VNKNRVQVSMILRAEIKDRLIAAAKRDGCTFSQAGERLLESALEIDFLLRKLESLTSEDKRRPAVSPGRAATAPAFHEDRAARLCPARDSAVLTATTRGASFAKGLGRIRHGKA
jgi:hypothetical protein